MQGVRVLRQRRRRLTPPLADDAQPSPLPLNVAKPEFLNAFELGLKSEWADRRVMANASAFYYDFSNQQFRNPVSGAAGCPGNTSLMTSVIRRWVSFSKPFDRLTTGTHGRTCLATSSSTPRNPSAAGTRNQASPAPWSGSRR